MIKTSFAALMLVGAVGVADAGGSPGTLGVGAEFQLAGTGGASLNYDAGDFHAGGFLGFFDGGNDNDTLWMLGGRFYYHLHSTTDADFGVGGSIGVASVPDQMGGDESTFIFLEPGVQIRLFLAANVAFSASTGIVLGLSDADGVAVTGSTFGGGGDLGGVGLAGGIGLHYYFF